MTWGVARVVLQLSSLFRLGEVGIVFFLLPMYFPSYGPATSYAYDFSALKAHDLAKFSGGCRSVRSKPRAKGLWCVPRVLGRVPSGGRKNNKGQLIINFGESRSYTSLKLVRGGRRGPRVSWRRPRAQALIAVAELGPYELALRTSAAQRQGRQGQIELEYMQSSKVGI